MSSSASVAARWALVALLAMTAIWGSTFFLIKDLVERVPVADLLAVRFAIAALALAVLAGPRLRLTPATLRSGALLGLLYGAAQLLQTAGLALTAASVSGFLTGLYVVATPLLAAAVLRVRVPASTWLAAGLATAGLAVLSLRGFSVGYGELLTVASAVVYAAHILALGRLTDPGSALGLSLVQLVVIAAVCTVGALPGGVQLPTGAADWTALLYLAVAAGAVTVLLQTWAQAHVEASRAAVVMAMEPVWAAGFAVGLGGESVTVRMVVGGAAILAAMYVVELAPRRRAVRTRPRSPGDGRWRAGGSGPRRVRTMSSDPSPEIDVRNNPESRAAEQDRSSVVSRASDGGPVPRDPRPAGTGPQPATTGAAAGDPVAGVTVSESDAAEAVSGDTGPDELGQRAAPPR